MDFSVFEENCGFVKFSNQFDKGECVVMELPCLDLFEAYIEITV